MGYLAIGALVVAAVAAGAAANEGRKARKLSVRQARAKAALERRQRFREERKAKGQVRARAAQLQAQGSSGEISTIGGISNQAAFNEGQSFLFQQRSEAISGRQQRAANFQTLSNVSSTFASGIS